MLVNNFGDGVAVSAIRRGRRAKMRSIRHSPDAQVHRRTLNDMQGLEVSIATSISTPALKAEGPCLKYLDGQYVPEHAYDRG